MRTATLTLESLAREIAALQRKVNELQGGTVTASINVSEEDGSPSVAASSIEVPNGTLTNDGGGVVSLDYAASGHTHGAIDHGALTGLGDDDHTQYLNTTRGDARYAPIAKGVTNGDAHDHNGGDGGQVDHVALANLNSASYTHLTAAQATDLTDGGETALHSHAGGGIGDWSASGNVLTASGGNLILDGTAVRITGQSFDLSYLNLGAVGTPTTPLRRVFLNNTGQLCIKNPAGVVTVLASTDVGVTNGDSHDHSGGDGAQIDHSGLANLNSASYTHLTSANHTDLTDGGQTTLHKHAGQFVAVTPTTLIDSAGNTWSAAARNTGTYTFRPGDNSNLWPTDASGVLLLLFGQWTTASSSSAVTLRQTSGGANEVQIKALVAGSGYNLQAVTVLDGSGYFYVLVEGANASSATVRILGYYL